MYNKPKNSDLINALKRHIREGNLKQVYLLYGEEDYLKQRCKDDLLAAVTEPDDTMNFHQFEGKNIDVKELISLADTMPFFASYRTILIRDSGWFTSSCEEIYAYLKKPAETVRFIFVEKEIDPKKKNKLFTLVSKMGYVIQLDKTDEKALKMWIKKLCKDEGKAITEESVDLFFFLTGGDMSNIRNELEKLFCYTYGRDQILMSDIEAIVTRKIDDRIFDMIDAIAYKQKQKALDLYYDFLHSNESPMKVLSLLTSQFNNLLMVKELRLKGYNKDGIEKKMEKILFNKKWLVGKKYMVQAKEFTIENLRDALIACVDADESVKTGKMTERLSVEMLIIKFCS